MADGPRYDDDFYAWTQYQAEVLRTMAATDNRFDREHVAEEIEDLGKSERDAVRSQIRRIIEHFLKLAYSPAEELRLDWMQTIDDARETLSDKLTATLHHDAEESLEKLYAEGRRRAARGLVRHGEPDAADALPAQCPYSLEEICREDWYPATPEE
jgi:acetyl-CoA carboxylase carboxyltransferase component